MQHEECEAMQHEECERGADAPLLPRELHAAAPLGVLHVCRLCLQVGMSLLQHTHFSTHTAAAGNADMCVTAAAGIQCIFLQHISALRIWFAWRNVCIGIADRCCRSNRYSNADMCMYDSTALPSLFVNQPFSLSLFLFLSLSIYICVYICVYIYTDICIYIYICVHLHIYTYIHISVYIYVTVYVLKGLLV